jgi:hypothetical protein
VGIFSCPPTHGLASGGVYIVEDIAANYWRPYRDVSVSFVDFTKWLIDAMHAHYQTACAEIHFRGGDQRRVAEHRVPLATTLIESIEFHDSIAVVRHSKGQRPVPVSVYR